MLSTLDLKEYTVYLENKPPNYVAASIKGTVSSRRSSLFTVPQTNKECLCFEYSSEIAPHFMNLMEIQTIIKYDVLQNIVMKSHCAYEAEIYLSY